MLEPGQRSRDCHRSRRKRRVRIVDKWPQAHSEARRPSETIASARARDSEPRGSMYPHCGWPLRPTPTLHYPSEPTRRRRRQAPPPLCHLGRFLGPQPTATRGMTTEPERTPLAYPGAHGARRKRSPGEDFSFCVHSSGSADLNDQLGQGLAQSVRSRQCQVASFARRSTTFRRSK